MAANLLPLPYLPLSSCHSEGALFFGATEESPSRAPLTIAINWFLVFYPRRAQRLPLPEIPRGTMPTDKVSCFCITIPRNITPA